MTYKKIEKGKVATLIPAHNEELVIAKTLEAVLRQCPKSDIYVVDDGSTDNTEAVIRKYTNNVLKIENLGKSGAVNKALKHFKLTNKYEYIFFMDADTQPERNFLKIAMSHFDSDPKEEINCVVGRVQGMGGSWVARYRLWEYEISHTIHKQAQSNLKSILVVPGCATVYRSEVFKKLKFPTGTLTEDMDFTFLMHRNGFNNMLFDDRCVVTTQDPQTLKEFVKQVNRWYTGFWQAVRKHNVPWGGQMLDFEVAMLASEGLYNGLVVTSLLASLVPLGLKGHLYIYQIPFFIDLFGFFIPTLLWSAVKNRSLKMLLNIPNFYFIRFLSSLLFFRSFFAGFLSKEKAYMWDTKRYLIAGGNK